MSKFTDFTEEEVDAFSTAGTAMAHGLLPAFHGISPYVAYNALGTMVAHIFAVVEFAEPQHALEEFDNWVKFTREHLADAIKRKMS